MHHHYYVGHFDPTNPLDRSERPYRPTSRRPIARECVDSVLAKFEPEIADYIHYSPDGYVLCSWSHAPFEFWERVGRFANALAEDEGAILMNEMFIIEFPVSARRTQEESWAEQPV